MTNIYWPPPEPDALGALVGADDVRDALRATIDLWSPYYVSIISARLAVEGLIGNPGQTAIPLSNFGKWVNEPTARSIGTGQPAAYLVRVLNTVGVPHVQAQGYGRTAATWRAAVTVQVFGTDWQEAADLTSWYEKAVRASVMQHRSLGDFATSTKWMGNSYAGEVHNSSRTEGQCILNFDIAVNDVIDVNRGPLQVPSPPLTPGPDPTADEFIVTLTKIPDDAPLEDI